MASTGPSQTIRLPASERLAKFIPKMTLLFLNAGVSEVLTYFRSSFSFSRRPAKATTSPLRSKIGKITRLRNTS